MFWKTIGETQKQIETSQNRREAKRKGQETYYDWNGAERLVENGKYIKRHTLDYGTTTDYVMEDEYGNIVHNYSQNQRDRRKKVNTSLARLNGNSVYSKPLSDNDKNNIHKKRSIYIDFNTGEELFCQTFNLKHYFRRVSDGTYVRRADMDLFAARKNNEDIDIYDGVMELNNRWNRNSPEEKKRMLEREMSSGSKSDLSVPSKIMVNHFYWRENYMTKNLGEYQKILEGV